MFKRTFLLLALVPVTTASASSEFERFISRPNVFITVHRSKVVDRTGVLITALAAWESKDPGTVAKALEVSMMETATGEYGFSGMNVGGKWGTGFSVSYEQRLHHMYIDLKDLPEVTRAFRQIAGSWRTISGKEVKESIVFYRIPSGLLVRMTVKGKDARRLYLGAAVGGQNDQDVVPLELYDVFNADGLDSLSKHLDEGQQYLTKFDPREFNDFPTIP